MKKLAKVLKMTLEEIKGQPKPEAPQPRKAEELDDDEEAEEGESQEHWGEIAIHFAVGPPLLMSISKTEYSRVWRSVQSDEGKFLVVTSLANQTVLVRRKAVTDLCFAHEAAGGYGPEEEFDEHGHFSKRYGDTGAHISRDWSSNIKGYWPIVEDLATDQVCRDTVEAKYGAQAYAKLEEHFDYSEEHIDVLIAAGNIPAEKRAEALEHGKKIWTEAENLATESRWQLSATGKVRSYELERDCFRWLSWTQYGDGDPYLEVIFLEGHDAQTFVLNPDAIDYLTIPTHALEEELEEQRREEEKAFKSAARAKKKKNVSR
jgi:hypothetical protein